MQILFTEKVILFKFENKIPIYLLNFHDVVKTDYLSFYYDENKFFQFVFELNDVFYYVKVKDGGVMVSRFSMNEI
ncbi:MAG: hypothetical protein JG759_414 [Thermoanaerobacter sp.]|jgi:hypothetical protein|nr:hypothetical protein [Thermoanaerobacter sp.]